MNQEDRAAAKAQKKADELARRMTLGIFCVECGQPCYLYTYGKDDRNDRWKCKNEEHN